MRRLPVDQTLEALVRRRELRPDHIDQLAIVLAQFYRDLTPLLITPDDYHDRYTAHVHGNLDELLAVSHHCPINMVRRVHAFQLQLLNICPELFAERVRRGCIVEGHGDLRPSTSVSRSLWRSSIASSSIPNFGRLMSPTNWHFWRRSAIF